MIEGKGVEGVELTNEQCAVLEIAKKSGFPESEWGRNNMLLYLKPSHPPTWIAFNDPFQCIGPYLACAVGWHADVRHAAIEKATVAFKAIKALEK